MCIQDQKCCAFLSLHSMGIPTQGCLYDVAWIRSIELPVSPSATCFVSLPHRTITFLQTIAQGSFGFIDRARYEEEGKDLYVKRPIRPSTKLLLEACVQQLVGELLTRHGWPHRVPAVRAIFRLPDRSVGFAMEEMEHATTLHTYLEGLPDQEFVLVVQECILQLCGMMWQLHHSLGMNHRDVKPSNLMIRQVIDHRIIQVEHELLEYTFHYSVILIDFGFSCVGSGISLSSVYPQTDPCPKEGRDMYLFLAFLYIDYHARLPARLRALFESWIDPAGSMCRLMRQDPENSKEWIYFITGDERLQRLECTPLRVFRDLCAMWGA
jgi:serine/threonine protein kinase